MAQSIPAPARPDGIRPEQAEAQRGHGATHANAASLLLLSGVVALGLSGAAGGRTAQWKADTAELSLHVTAPKVIRNGNIFETTVRVAARAPIEKLVIGIEAALWREVTINSTVPAAARESFRAGFFRYQFEALPAGGSFEFKIDQQLNPALEGSNRGRIVVFDGERAVVEIPMSMRVLP